MKRITTAAVLAALALSGAGFAHHKLVALQAFVNQYSLATDGTGDFVDIGAPADLGGAPNAAEHTISAWIRINGAAGTNNQMFVAKNDGVNLQYGCFRTTSGALSFYAGGVESTGGATIPNDAWRHVVCVVRNESPYKNRGFIGGIQTTTTANTGAATNSANWTLGKNSNALPLYLNGYIDEVTFWDIGLSNTEITELYNAGKPGNPKTHSQAAHLIHWYRFDGDTGGVARDWAGSSNGTYNGNAALSTTVP